MRFKWANGSVAAFGAALATSGFPKTFQNLSVSSPAADATVHPSGLWKYTMIWTNVSRTIGMAKHARLEYWCEMKMYIYLSHVKNSRCMASELSYFHHWRILPQSELILSETVGAKQLALVFVPQKSADLWACVHWVQARTGVCVPEFYAPVTSTSTGGEQIALERTPRKRLDSGRVVLKPVKPLRRSIWRCRRSVPYMEEIVVSTTSQLLSRGWPFKPTNFLLMASVGFNDVCPNSYIIVDDPTIHPSSSQDVIVPVHSTNSWCMAASQSPQLQTNERLSTLETKNIRQNSH